MGRRERETAEFHGVETVSEDGNKLYCLIDGRRVMIPKSEIDDDSEVYELGTSGTLVIPEWLAIDRGLV